MCCWKHRKWFIIVTPFYRQERWGSEKLSNLPTLRQLVAVLGFKPRILVYTTHISFLSVAPCGPCSRLLQFPIWHASPKQLPELCWCLSHNWWPLLGHTKSQSAQKAGKCCRGVKDCQQWPLWNLILTCPHCFHSSPSNGFKNMSGANYPLFYNCYTRIAGGPWLTAS